MEKKEKKKVRKKKKEHEYTLLGVNNAKSAVLGNDVSQHGHMQGMEDGHGKSLCGYEHKVHEGVVQQQRYCHVVIFILDCAAPEFLGFTKVLKNASETVSTTFHKTSGWCVIYLLINNKHEICISYVTTQHYISFVKNSIQIKYQQ